MNKEVLQERMNGNFPIYYPTSTFHLLVLIPWEQLKNYTKIRGRDIRPSPVLPRATSYVGDDDSFIAAYLPFLAPLTDARFLWTI